MWTPPCLIGPWCPYLGKALAGLLAQLEAEEEKEDEKSPQPPHQQSLQRPAEVAPRTGFCSAVYVVHNIYKTTLKIHLFKTVFKKGANEFDRVNAKHNVLA